MIKLEGNWDLGVAYDYHMLKSTPIGEDIYGRMRFDNQRTPMGELMYQLKYQNNIQVVIQIVDLLFHDLFSENTLNKFHAIVPAPNTKKRFIQPVHLICQEISNRVNVPILPILHKQDSHISMKNMENKHDKLNELQKSIYIDHTNLSDRNILLVDDLYDTGATLEISTEKLKHQGAKNVVVLTMTKTKG